MKPWRLKITERDFEDLKQLVLADMPKEAGAFALAGYAVTKHSVDILVRRTISVPRSHFAVQHEFRLEIASQAINGLIALCESNGLGAVLCHSHPGNSDYSSSDNAGEKRIFEALRQFTPSEMPMASLLFYPNGVKGRVWVPNSPSPLPLSEIIVVGKSIQHIRLCDASHPGNSSSDEIYSRQILAFGEEGQRIIARTKVGIVGLGGTGSPTAEQLARLGVQDFVLLDPERFDLSNITRVYGSLASTLQRRWWQLRGKPPFKVDLIAAHLKKISPRIKVQAIHENVVVHDAAVNLVDRDVIFLCTDEHWGRSVVNQIAYQYLIPTINLGMRISANEGKISSAAGVVDMLRPDMPCLWCSQFLRADRIAAESMPGRFRKSLEREGYVENLSTPAPSVVSITTTISGMAVTLFLQLITDFMGQNGAITRLNYDVLEGTIRRGRTTDARDCVCKQVRGFGDLKSLPTLACLC